ncbi:MAG: hypothetical protein AAF449_07170, partial [Myxococcota bacterium]
MSRFLLPIARTIGFSLCVAATACGGQNAAPGPQPAAGAAAINAATSGRLQPGGQAGATDDVRTADIDNDGRPEVFKYYQSIPDPDKPGQRKTVLVRQ